MKIFLLKRPMEQTKLPSQTVPLGYLGHAVSGLGSAAVTENPK